MGEVWPTAHITELCLHSLPAQGLETEMSTALQTQSCERALLTTGLPLLFYLLNPFMTWKVVVMSHQSVCLNVCSIESDDFFGTGNTENGIDGCISEQYVCGECGEIFSRELDVKSHMFTKHMCEYELFALWYLRFLR